MTNSLGSQLSRLCWLGFTDVLNPTINVKELVTSCFGMDMELFAKWSQTHFNFITKEISVPIWCVLPKDSTSSLPCIMPKMQQNEQHTH